ncbi:MAG: hypothetical protein CR981_01385 [Proteobacteria bacterium]|nr:MAG: hypothetical protein CR981_01385 [Pseudomonadota bacterium]PIE64232.1 MAG: hypothetical protein CSA26_09135 [Desulfobacterales bacterium]
MKLPADSALTLLQRLMISIAISALLIALLIRFTLNAADSAVWPRLFSVISASSLTFLIIYTIFALIRTTLQASRYSTLIAAAGETPPSRYHLFLVSLSRNMFVDMLPGRLGELSYIAMLNRGCRLSSQVCISSLLISFVFDLIALLFLILVLIPIQLITGTLQGWLAGASAVLGIIVLILLFLCYPVLKTLNRLVPRFAFSKKGFPARLYRFMKKSETAFSLTAQAGVTARITILSIAIRVLKYLGLYILFVGIVNNTFPGMTTAITSVFPALISAEAGASLPIPTFLGLGTYEAGGSMALIALGADKSSAFIVMLAMHIISQIGDYLLGIVGCVLFLFKAKQGQIPETGQRETQGRLLLIVITLFILIAFGFLVLQITAVKKRGSFKPPAAAKTVFITEEPSPETDLKGFMVWSSNRSGNQDFHGTIPHYPVRENASGKPHLEPVAIITETYCFLF